MAAIFEYPKHVGFICNKCSRCCGNTKEKVRHVLLLKTDANRISTKTFLDSHEFAEEISGFKPYIYQMRKTKHGRCYFLRNSLCTIYKIRPLICRFYPFQLKNLGNNRYSFSFTKSCPCIGKGTQHKKVFFKNLFSKFMTSMEENIEKHIC